MYTNKSRPFTIPIIFMTRGVASTVGRGINPVIAPATHAHTFKHSTFTMQPVHYHL